MNHVEEGTIHAWLDSALDAAQSAEVDAHVKSCAECSAKVAEARGLIAASSRILVSLDDTPANVIPRKAAVAPRRPRRMAPWVSGLAAAAIIVTLWRTSGVEQPTARSEINIPDIAARSAPEPLLTELRQPAPPTISTPSAPVVAEQRQAKVANTPRVADGRAVGAGAVGGLAASAASDLASAPVSSPSPTTAIRAMTSRQDAQRREVAAAEELRRPPVDVLTTRQSPTLKDEAVTVVGCYRIPDPPKLQLESITAVGAAQARAPERAARARGAVSSSAPAPAAVQKAADADVVQGVVVRLDSLGLVRAIGSDSIMGSWDHFRADSARVRFGSRTPFVSSLNKVRCP